MEFESIHVDTDCNCIYGASQDIDSIYVRKISNLEVLEKDLKSHWEKGTRIDDDCNLICGYKGLSINIWNENSQKSIITKFLLTFGISQKSKSSLYIFKFKENAGLLKHTPTKDDEHHYTFYKSDNFKPEMLEKVEIKELRSFLE